MKIKFDKRTEKRVLSVLDKLVMEIGLRDVSHAVHKWDKQRMVRAAVQKERRRLRERLAELGG